MEDLCSSGGGVLDLTALRSSPGEELWCVSPFFSMKISAPLLGIGPDVGDAWKNGHV